MSDPFEELGLPKALAIAPEDIESAYRKASKRLHPDMGGDEKSYEAMRKAADLLRCPSQRLRWALGAVGGNWDERGSVPMSVMDLFSPIAEALQKVEGFIDQRNRAKSALGRAVLDAGVPTMKRELEATLAKLELEESYLVSRFDEFDQRGWRESAEEMAEAARGLAFVEKWQGQIRAATGKLFQALLGGA